MRNLPQYRGKISGSQPVCPDLKFRPRPTVWYKPWTWPLGPDLTRNWRSNDYCFFCTYIMVEVPCRSLLQMVKTEQSPPISQWLHLFFLFSDAGDGLVRSARTSFSPKSMQIAPYKRRWAKLPWSGPGLIWYLGLALADVLHRNPTVRSKSSTSFVGLDRTVVRTSLLGLLPSLAA